MKSLQRNRFKVWLFQQAVALANALAKLPNRVTPPPFRLIQMGSAYWQSRALYVAADLGVADALGDGERTSAELAEAVRADADHLYRLLRMLASQGVFAEVGERRFRNSALSQCLRSDHHQSVRALVLMHNSPELSRPWFEELGPAIRSGEVPFVRRHGEALFEYMNGHPEFDRLFTQAMESVEALIGASYLEDFDWGRFERLIDVGGSNGAKSLAILGRHPKLRALVFDRPPVVAEAEAHWAGRVDAKLMARLEFSGGDMLEGVPPARSHHDLYLFAAIFHGMGDDDAHTLLTNLQRACGDHRPTIVIADTVAAEQGIDPTVAGFDMQMLVGTRGRERTLAEWRALLVPHGFGIDEVVDVRSFVKLLVVR